MKSKLLKFWGIVRSGTKVTVKRPAPSSPANIRHTDPRNGYNPQHTHVKVPPALVKKP